MEYQNFWELCRIARKEAGYTLKDVARESGYTHQNISRFECGKNLSVNLDILLWYIRNTRIVDMVKYYEKKDEKVTL